MPGGRPRKPTARKELEGDQPCRINRNEPVPPAGGVGPPPKHLDELGVEAWHRLAKLLAAMKVLTSADAEALAIYCVNYSTWIQARKDIREKGMTVTTQFSFKPHPMLSVARSCESQMNRILSQFGMTPAARSALNLGGNGEPDAFDEYIKGNQSQNGKAKAD